MIICLGKSSSFRVLCVLFVTVYQSLYLVILSLLVLRKGVEQAVRFDCINSPSLPFYLLFAPVLQWC